MGAGGVQETGTAARIAVAGRVWNRLSGEER